MTAPVPRHLSIAIAWLGVELLGLLLAGMTLSEPRSLGTAVGFWISLIAAIVSLTYIVTGLTRSMSSRHRVAHTTDASPGYLKTLELAFASWLSAAVAVAFDFAGSLVGLRWAQFAGFVVTAVAVMSGFVVVVVGVIVAVVRAMRSPPEGMP